MDKIGGAFESITGTGENTNRVQSQSQSHSTAGNQTQQEQQTSPTANESSILGSLGDKLSSAVGATGGNAKVERVCYIAFFIVKIFLSRCICLHYIALCVQDERKLKV